MKRYAPLFFSALLLLSSCTIHEVPASNAFYINDTADALLTSTQYYVYNYAKVLYEVDSQKAAHKNNKINGTQIVVTTHMGSPGSINTTDIFNDWGIGANDMGLLLMLYFEADPLDKYTPIYLGMTREIGAKMAGFISQFRLEEIFIDTWESDMFLTVHRNDYDYKLIYFYTALLEEIYTRVYDYASFPRLSVMADYEIDQYKSFYNRIPKGTTPRIKLAWWIYVIIALVLIIFIGTGRFWIFFFIPGASAKGAGGRSHGYRYTR